ncbi:hypothetical protein I79_016111 [Cricetulus griseus]|uniref:Uncharacterized protein n=1 Tax=Cricetulus griseus TaxID=10029 RepID=G3HYH8_CRIGR|nr:hypothetical protein I79_016111 [Cricetulus griseus]
MVTVDLKDSDITGSQGPWVMETLGLKPGSWEMKTPLAVMADWRRWHHGYRKS